MTRPSLQFSSRDRRALRLLLAVAVPALAFAFVVKPLIGSTRAARDELETQRNLLRREQALVALGPSLPARIGALRGGLDRERGRLYGSTDPVAATGSLSKDISAAFTDAGIALQHLETREPVARPGGVRELTVELRAEGDFEGILDVLTALEGGDHLVRVSRIAIDRGSVATGQNASSESLAIAATVHGYMESRDSGAARSAASMDALFAKPSEIRVADTTTDALLDSALDVDPFSASRQAPDVRYGTPLQTIVLQPAPPPPDPLRLVGTVVDSVGGSFVLCQMGAGVPRVLRVGQRFGLFELRSIAQGVATFVSTAGQRLELRVPKNGS